MSMLTIRRVDLKVTPQSHPTEHIIHDNFSMCRIHYLKHPLVHQDNNS